MTYYISTSITLYSPINKNAGEIQEYVKEYNNCLFDQESLDDFVDKVRNKSAQLEIENKRSLPMVIEFDDIFINHKFGQIKCLRIYQKDHPDKTILSMDFAKVRKIIRYKKEFDIVK